MIRKSLVAGDLNVDLVLTPAHGVQMNRRFGLDGYTETVASLNGIVAPYWLRLTIINQAFTGYLSSDGTHWRELGTTPLAGWITGSSFIGMVNTSQSPSTRGTDVFSNVTLLGVPGGGELE